MTVFHSTAKDQAVFQRDIIMTLKKHPDFPQVREV